ncbi:tryptophan synthase beta subunit-like PLP-dependent enzyme [Talaromyces proteolyticus]|uniref:L-serine ammonia-lyase n=1 Tax=Talaromyces proteolyticus TaxID=1131652 RepID=A0AAD4PY51_9EURO|nr:tryptophan synthase beta subunit-like PLP-dependent enzyme [Talaromyces proteolyticus]KAH8693701.1 tryptophan synthase beta subunit-like PLP-dependent enzyme [Talaromyces proteolyticus]
MGTAQVHPSLARRKQQKPWIETPLVESSVLSKAAGCRVFLKLENLQPGGSFKSRAMGNLILYHINSPLNAGRKLHFYINSGGNAGLAAVCAARSLAYPCTVVLPMTASRLIIEKLTAAGATQVIQHGQTIAEAGVYMKNAVMKEHTPGAEDVVKIALHPFDHEAIWEGNSSIVDELAWQLPPADEEGAFGADVLVCSVGGGGLMNGLIQGIGRQQQQDADRPAKDVHILAVETDGTQSMALAMAQKSLVTLPKVTSMAVSLACVRVSEQTFEYCIAPPPGIVIHSAVLSDADAARGCLRIADDERILVELACGVCIEAVIGDKFKSQRQKQRQNRQRKKMIGVGDEGYGDEQESGAVDSAIGSDVENEAGASLDSLPLSHLKQLVPNLTPESRVVIIVCGGSNVTTGLVSEWREKLADGWV